MTQNPSISRIDINELLKNLYIIDNNLLKEYLKFVWKVFIL
jgi:hypothetical protein